MTRLRLSYNFLSMWTIVDLMAFWLVMLLSNYLIGANGWLLPAGIALGRVWGWYQAKTLVESIPIEVKDNE